MVAPGSEKELVETGTKRTIGNLALYDDALASLNSHDYALASVKFESLVADQPKFYEAWYYLALARAWAARPHEKILEAAHRARELAPSERDEALLTGLISFLQRDYRGAQDQLAALHEGFPKDADILYLYAEATYHNGHHRKGIELFNKTLQVAPGYRLAGNHPFHYALASGNTESLKYLVDIIHRRGVTDFLVAFSAHRYEKALSIASPIERYQALAVLGRDAEAEEEIASLDGPSRPPMQLYRVARLLELGQRDQAKKIFAQQWENVKAKAGRPGGTFGLGHLFEVLAMGEMHDELRLLLTYWELPGSQTNIAQRRKHQIIAALGLRDPALVPRAGYRSDGEMVLAAAVRAQLKGDFKKALKQWQALLADPSQNGDYLARWSAINLLGRLGRTEERDELCRTSLSPSVFRASFPLLRRACSRPTQQ
jgi:tetratricopeptide (TPR) repeat protein